MEKRPNTPKRIAKRKYEAIHKEERKQLNKVWGTSISRETAEEIDAFLKEYNISKVELICVGYEALKQRFDSKQ